jgi:hypothetical protein
MAATIGLFLERPGIIYYKIQGIIYYKIQEGDLGIFGIGGWIGKGSDK